MYSIFILPNKVSKMAKAESKLNIDDVINILVQSGGKNVKIKEKDVSLLCRLTREIFMEQPVFLELEAPIKICGKLSGSDFWNVLVKIFM